MLLLIACFVICGVNGYSVPYGKDCAVSIRDIVVGPKNVLPLIVNKAKDPVSFHYPDAEGVLHVSFNETITLACPGEANFLLSVSRMPWTADAICLGDNEFRVGKQAIPFEQLRCKYNPQNEIRKVGHCEWSITRLAIGFDLLENGFLKSMEVCFDENSLRPVYSQYRLRRSISGQQMNHTRPFWSGWKFYPRHNLKFLYRRDTQFRTIVDTLGSEELAEEYFDYDNRYFLSRGHLTANRDFIYATEQMATFWFPNMMPQWNVFNSGNWMYLEINVRDFAAKRNLDLDVFTGVFGQASLEVTKNDTRPLFLSVNGKKKAIAVPRFYWKILYHPETRRGTAFIGLNEPHAKTIEQHMYLCDDISSSADFSWLTWTPNDISAGFSYICDVQQLRKSVPGIPKLDIVGVLS